MCPPDCPIGGVTYHGAPIRACERRFDEGCINALQGLGATGDLGITLDLSAPRTLYDATPVQLELFPMPRQGRLFPAS